MTADITTVTISAMPKANTIKNILARAKATKATAIFNLQTKNTAKQLMKELREYSANMAISCFGKAKNDKS